MSSCLFILQLSKSSSFDQEEQFELYEFLLENNMECKTIDATDLSEDGEEFCLNKLKIQ